MHRRDESFESEAQPLASDIQSVALVSLGCPKNLVDSERMLGLLAGDGLAVTADAADADAIVINTCGFLAASREEALEEIRQAVRLKTSGRCKRVIVAGCLVQRDKLKLLREAPGIDRLVGVFDREHIVQAVRGPQNAAAEHGHFLGKYHDLSRQLEQQIIASPVAIATAEPAIAIAGQTKTRRLRVFEDDRARLRLTPRHYAYLRISEGCNQGCSFCTIPSIRGPMRSKPIERILVEAAELAADGAVELNLIGQDTTSFGTDIGYQGGLASLIRTLDRQLTDIAWLRLMYAYPSCFSDEMIDALAQSPRFVRYIDMPLQHINDQVLARMKRRVTRKQTEALLAKLRDRIPGITLRTTFIAGSPGETETQHRELLKFVQDFGFDMMGVFPFSAEPGTPMGRASDQISESVKQQRMEELMLAQQKVAFAKAKKTIGQQIKLLIDRPAGRDREDGWVARSAAQAPEIDSVTYLNGQGAANLRPGMLVDAIVTDYQAYDLVARMVAV
jgi:ribosomal protein S12 methylthiotransferase